MKRKQKCITFACDNPAITPDGYCSDECRKTDYEDELGYQRISTALSSKSSIKEGRVNE